MLGKVLQKLARKIESKMPRGVQVKGTQNSIEVHAEDYMLFRDQGVDGIKRKNDPSKKYDLGTKFSYKGKMPPSKNLTKHCLLYTSPSPRDGLLSRMPSSA